MQLEQVVQCTCTDYGIQNWTIEPNKLSPTMVTIKGLLAKFPATLHVKMIML